MDSTVLRNRVKRLATLAEVLAEGPLGPEEILVLTRAFHELESHADAPAVAAAAAPAAAGTKRSSGGSGVPTKRAKQAAAPAAASPAPPTAATAAAAGAKSSTKRYDTPSYCRNDGRVKTFCFGCGSWHEAEHVSESHNFRSAGVGVSCKITTADETTLKTIEDAKVVFRKLKNGLTHVNKTLMDTDDWDTKRWSFEQVFQALVHLVQLVHEKNLDAHHVLIVDLKTNEFPKTFPDDINDLGLVVKGDADAVEKSDSDEE